MGPAFRLLVSSLELGVVVVVAALTLILLPLTRQLDVERVDESGQRLAVISSGLGWWLVRWCSQLVCS